MKRENKKRPLRLEWIEAGSLADNPQNWRRHPKGQMKALKNVLDDVGWAGALLYNERTERLIDGHARKEAVSPKTPVPVLVGRWSEEQEKKILLTLDPIGAMAEANSEALEGLLKDVELKGPGMKELETMLDGLAEKTNDPPPARSRKRPATARRKGPKTVGFSLGTFSFTVGRQQYDTWLSAIEAKAGSDADQVIKEIKRRLKI